MISQAVFQALTCDGPGCDKSEVIEASDAVSTAKIIEQNPWIKNHRIVQTMSKRDPQTNQPVMYQFCSDVCLVKAATAGMFVPTEEKKIETPVATATPRFTKLSRRKLVRRQRMRLFVTASRFRSVRNEVDESRGAGRLRPAL